MRFRSLASAAILIASAAFAMPALAASPSTNIVIDTGASKVLQANLSGDVGDTVKIDQTNALNVVDLTGDNMSNATVSASAAKVIQANVGVGIDLSSGIVKDTQTNAANVVDAVLTNVGNSSVDKVSATMHKVAQVNVGVNLPLMGGTAVSDQVNAGNIVSVKIK